MVAELEREWQQLDKDWVVLSQIFPKGHELQGIFNPFGSDTCILSYNIPHLSKTSLQCLPEKMSSVLGQVQLREVRPATSQWAD